MNTSLIGYLLFFFTQIPLSQVATLTSKNTVYLPPVTNDSLEIQHLSLKNNQLLYSEVEKYIKEQEDSCQLFKNGFGYVTISNLQLGRIGQPVPIDSLSNRLKEIEVKFDLGLSSFYPHQRIGTPLYYSFVNERLVLIFNLQSEWLHQNNYSVKSQNQVKSLIASTLLDELNPNFVFRGLSGNTFRLNQDKIKELGQEHVFELGSFTLDRWKTVTQYFDKSVYYRYPPIYK